VRELTLLHQTGPIPLRLHLPMQITILPMTFWAQIGLLVLVIATIVVIAPHFEGITLASVAQ
jgi:hypothetical protein